MPVYRLTAEEREAERQSELADREMAYNERDKQRQHELDLARIEAESRVQAWDKKLELAEKRQAEARILKHVELRYRTWLLLVKGPALTCTVFALLILRLFGKDSPALEAFLNS